MQTATLPAMAHDQENVAPVSKAPQPAPEPEKKKKYVGASKTAVVGTTRAHPLSDKSRPIVASLPFFASSAPLTATTAFPTAFPTATLVATPGTAPRR
jgi:hypothetical protein